MSTYLVIKNGTMTKSYTCKESASTPYLKVSNSYLPLTTQTGTGLHVKASGSTFIPQASYTTTVVESYYKGETGSGNISTTVEHAYTKEFDGRYYTRRSGSTSTYQNRYSCSLTISEIYDTEFSISLNKIILTKSVYTYSSSSISINGTNSSVTSEYASDSYETIDFKNSTSISFNQLESYTFRSSVNYSRTIVYRTYSALSGQSRIRNIALRYEDKTLTMRIVPNINNNTSASETHYYNEYTSYYKSTTTAVTSSESTPTISEYHEDTVTITIE